MLLPEVWAWRWQGHNPDLGGWLLAIRPVLMAGEPLDLRSADIPGLAWVPSRRGEVQRRALAHRDPDASVLVLGQFKPDTDKIGQDLMGVYGVMEDLQGDFMSKFMGQIESCGDREFAHTVACFAKSCMTGLAGINQPLLDRLRKGRTVSDLKREGLRPVQVALDALLQSPSIDSVASAMTTIGNTPRLRLYKKEAWNDCLRALHSASAGDGISPTEALNRLRDSLRRTGRRPSARIVSRTVLVKGLEYDHVIIANAERIKDSQNLYVALTRGRKSVTVVSTTPLLGA